MSNTPKTIIVIILAFALLLCFASCSNRNSNSSKEAAEPASLSWEKKDAFWETYAPEDTSPVPLNATNCWTILSDEEGYVYGVFDGRFCAMKKKDSSHIIGFSVSRNDDGSYEINYNTGTEWYYEQFDRSAWQMHDGISRKYIYNTLYIDKDYRYIEFEDKNDNEDLFLMDKAMFENYIEFTNLSEQNQADIMEKYELKAEDPTARETAMLKFLDFIKNGEFKQETLE